MGSSAINPNFTTQGSRPLPLLFGYGLASGDTMIPFTTADGVQLAYIALSDGECDGIEQYAFVSTDMLYSGGLALSPQPGGVFNEGGLQVAGPANSAVEGLSKNGSFIYFHSGQWTPIGIPQTPFSAGPDQGYDALFGQIPSVTPPQAFNNICYAVVSLNPTTRTVSRTTAYPSGPLQFFGIIRGTRCRYFDTNGNVTGYGFTTNPTWHMMEVLLRYKFKRQQPQIAGLTAAEKACFNWPAIVAHAAYNDTILANGAKRFTGNYVFASTATLTSMLETMLRCCQSYIDDQDGQIGFFNFQQVDSTFFLTANHIVAGSFKVEKKDLTNAPNVFVPAFRDLNIQALVPVTNLTISTGGNNDGYDTVQSGLPAAYFDTNGQNPFATSQIIYYGDSDTPSLNADYITLGMAAANPAPNVWCWVPSKLGTTNATANGGYLGTQTSRFGQRSPNTVQHSHHQKATGIVSPGITPLPNIKEVKYDLGNMSYDQANRLMQYQMNSQLNNDVDGWVAPLTGSVTIQLEAVDQNGNAFIRQRPNMRFTVDSYVSPEFAGDYLITDLTPVPPSRQAPLGEIQVNFRSYNPNAFSDTSYAPDASLRTIASAALQYVNSSVSLPNVAWVIQATPSIATASGGTLTITIPDLTLQLLGAVGFTAPVAGTWTGLTSGTTYTLFYNPAGVVGGSGPTAQFFSLAGTVVALEFAGTMPAAGYPILSGAFTATTF